MPADMNVLSEQITNKSFSDCSIEELQQLTADYPYFAPAHFLLLKKLDPASQAYREQYQKAILYFHDPLSFDYFINRSPSDFQVDFPEETTEEEEKTVSNEPVAAETELRVKQETETILPEAEHSDTISATEDEQVASEILAEQTTVTIDPAPANEGITFEPFHTVDYFASQGIRLSQEETGNDKFGKQLKSFTDWLKTMKKLPAVQKSAPDPVTEQKVEHLADNSVQEADVITEAMAEVWLKQGNRQKAAEVYEKLSLSDPSKSAYFAAKIESLQQ